MQVKAGVVNSFLSFGKFSIHRHSPSEVCAITTVFLAKIHQYHFSVFAFLVIRNVMKGACTVATGNNTIVGNSGCPVLIKLVEDLCFNFIFHHPWSNKTEQPPESFFCNIYCLLHYRYFVRRFNRTQLLHYPRAPLVMMKRVSFSHFLCIAVIPYRHEVSLSVIFVGVEVDVLSKMYPGLK